MRAGAELHQATLVEVVEARAREIRGNERVAAGDDDEGRDADASVLERLGMAEPGAVPAPV